MRQVRKLGWYGAIIILVPLIAAVLGASIPKPLFANTDREAAEPTRGILLLYNPIHTDIAFPADPDVLEKLGFLRSSGLPMDHPGVAWIMLGWGGRSFYLETPTWSDLKPGPVFNALTIDSSVMHVVLAGEIDPENANVSQMFLSELQFETLLNRAIEGFRRDQEGTPQLIAGKSYGDYDRFFEAEGYFNALVGCNTWAAAVLRAGGARTGVWNPLPVSLRWSLRLFGSCPGDGRLCRL